MEETIQHGVRKSVRPLTRRYQMDTLSMNYGQLNTTVYSDIIFYDVNSLRGNTCTHIFTADSLVQSYHKKDKSYPNLIKDCPLFFQRRPDTEFYSFG